MLCVNAAINVGNQFERQHINAWKICGCAFGEMRQFPVETSWQMSARSSDLFLDEMKIIQQPFRRRRDVASFFDALSLGVVIAQKLRVGLQARQKKIGAVAVADFMALRQSARVAFQQVDAEQLTAKRLFTRSR